MTSLQTDGYLSQEAVGIEAEFVKRYAAKYQLSTSANQYAHRLIFKISISSNALQDLLLSTLLARQTETFQAFILLAKRGLLNQCDMLVRALAETMFIVGAIRKDAEFAERYVLADEIARKKNLVRLNNDKVRRGEPPDPEAQKLVEELDVYIRERSISKLSTESISQTAGLESYYDTIYGFMSMAIHSSSRSLDKAMKSGEAGTVSHIEYGPELDGFDMRLDYALSVFLYVLHEIASHFKEDVSDIEALQKQNQALAGAA
jgi:hypothetical protein